MAPRGGGHLAHQVYARRPTAGSSLRLADPNPAGPTTPAAGGGVARRIVRRLQCGDSSYAGWLRPDEFWFQIVIRDRLHRKDLTMPRPPPAYGSTDRVRTRNFYVSLFPNSQVRTSPVWAGDAATGGLGAHGRVRARRHLVRGAQRRAGFPFPRRSPSRSTAPTSWVDPTGTPSPTAGSRARAADQDRSVCPGRSSRGHCQS